MTDGESMGVCRMWDMVLGAVLGEEESSGTMGGGVGREGMFVVNFIIGARFSEIVIGESVAVGDDAEARDAPILNRVRCLGEIGVRECRLGVAGVAVVSGQVGELLSQSGVGRVRGMVCMRRSEIARAIPRRRLKCPRGGAKESRSIREGGRREFDVDAMVIK